MREVKSQAARGFMPLREGAGWVAHKPASLVVDIPFQKLIGTSGRAGYRDQAGSEGTGYRDQAGSEGTGYRGQETDGEAAGYGGEEAKGQGNLDGTREAEGRRLEVLEEERPRCERMLVDGRRCAMPAHDGWKECYRHGRWYAALPPSLGMPYPEDAVAIQELLGRAVAMVMNREITPQQASVIARLCGEMRQNLWAFQQEMKQSEGEMERKRASRARVV